MFYFCYKVNPLSKKISNTLNNRTNMIFQQNLSRMSSDDNKKNIEHCIKLIIKAFSDEYCFSSKRFLKANFNCKNHVLFLQRHDDNLKSAVVGHNQWECDSTNIAKILKEIKNEAKQISKCGNIKELQDLCSHQQKVYIDNGHNRFIPISSIIQNTKRINSKVKGDALNHCLGLKSFCSDYRQALQKFYNPYDIHDYEFTGTVERYVNQSPHGVPGVVIIGVEHHGELVAQHCWFFGNDLKAIKNSHAFTNDEIKFYAHVEEYTKYSDVKSGQNDFNLVGISQVEVINSSNDDEAEKGAGITPNSNSMYQALINLYDPQQLQFLIKSKFRQNNLSISKIKKRLKPLLACVRNLKQQMDYLSSENEKAKTILDNSKQNVIKQNDKKLYTLQRPKQIQQTIRDLWNGIDASRIVKNHNTISMSDVSKLRSTAKKLMNYLNRLDDSFQLQINGLSSVVFTTLDVKKVILNFKKAEQTALSDFQKPNRQKSIAQIEDDNHLAHGTLARLRAKNIKKANI